MTFRLRLDVAGDAADSVSVRDTVASMFEGAVEDVLEEEDVFEQPRRAVEDRILATRTLVRLSPAPQIMLRGNLEEDSAPRRLSVPDTEHVP